jgi:hypothetical protein
MSSKIILGFFSLYFAYSGTCLEGISNGGKSNINRDVVK